MVGSKQMTKLNIGCGNHYQQGWVNIDADRDVKCDRHATILDLPFDDNSFDMVYAGHVLEHIPLHEVISACREVYRVLKPGRHACFVGPDFYEGVTNGHSQGILDGIVHGAGRWEKDEHLWVCTFEAVAIAVQAAGFYVTEYNIETIDGWPIVSRSTWQFAMTGAKLNG